MSYGLSKFIKGLLPRRLFYRALLIVAVPIIVLQIVITIVFFDSLWIKTNKGMTRALVNEVKTFIEVYNNENFDKDEITNLFSVYQDLNFEFVEDDNFEYISYKLNRLEQCELIIDNKTQKLYNLKIIDLRNKILFLKKIKRNLKNQKLNRLL